MKITFWESKIFRLWFVYYLLVMILPALFCIGFYSYTIKAMEQEAYTRGELVIKQLGDMVDTQLASISSISDAVHLSSNIYKIKYLSLPFTAKKYSELHSRAKYLENFSAYPDLIRHVYVYYRDMHCLLDAGHIYTEINQFDAIVTNRIGLRVEQFTELTQQTHRHDYFVLGEGNSILYMRTLATKGEEKRPSVTLCIVLNTDAIRNLFQDSCRNTEGSVYMMLPDGQHFGSTAMGDPKDYAELSALQKTSSRIPYNDNIVNITDSDVSDFRYVLSVPRDSFLHDISRTQLIFLSCLAVVLCFGTFTAYAFAIHNYKPLHMLKKLARIPEKGQDDFADLGGKLSELLDSEDKMHEEIEQLNLIASSSLFYALLSGDMKALKKRQLEQLHSLFTGNVFVAAHINFDEEVDEEVLSGVSQHRENMGVLISTLTNDLCDHQCEYIVRRDGEAFAGIFCFTEGTNTNDAQFSVQEIANKLADRLLAHLNLPVLICIGDAQHGKERIHTSYMNAKKTREYVEFVAETEKRVVLFNESMFSSNISWADFDIVDAERRFVSLMLDGNYEAGEQMLNDILAYYSYKDGMSLYIMRCRMFGVINMMINVLHEVEPDLDASFYEENTPIEKLLAVRTTKELEEVVFHIIDYLIGKKESEKAIDVDDKLAQVEAYVFAHYYDPNLSVQQIAETFELSLPYLSRLFKRERGLGLLEYINRHRIHKAKEIILADGRLTNSAVAKEVGYHSSQTFIRIFKRYEGHTPGRYRGGAKAEEEWDPHE